ncbi:hypothetical protein [Pseudolysinimonas sp.]|jgi:hypothetical protein|uniref:hypothetical protein n=1 Tax=Pseudolysinimonas sp. TaxID=2680009 RepID=UPI003784DA95
MRTIRSHFLGGSPVVIAAFAALALLSGCGSQPGVDTAPQIDVPTVEEPAVDPNAWPAEVPMLAGEVWEGKHDSTGWYIMLNVAPTDDQAALGIALRGLADLQGAGFVVTQDNEVDGPTAHSVFLESTAYKLNYVYGYYVNIPSGQSFYSVQYVLSPK